MQDEEIIQSFVEESKAHIDSIENELININLDEVDMDSINNIFRAVHTIKGTSGFFNFKSIVALSHGLENLFGEIRSGKTALTNDMVDTLLKANDGLRVMIGDLTNSENVEISGLVEELSGFIGGHSVAEAKVAEIEGADEATFDIGAYLMPEAKKQRILRDVRQGSRLYLLKRRLYRDIINNDYTMVDLLNEINSMGSVINITMDSDGLVGAMEAQDGDVWVEILFTTVLERDFLPPLLGEPEDSIAELSVMTEPETAVAQKPHEGVPEKEFTDTPAVLEPDAGLRNIPLKEKQKGGGASAEDSVRVNVTLLNSLLNLSSEMVLARNQLFRRMENHRKEVPGIDVIFQNINHITSNLQETVMQTRMQPVSNVFSKFPRIARELSKKLGKDITLELQGSEVELDKSIVEALGDPLTHLVRNAIDHGMESPDERIRRGKSRMGTIKLKAYHESGYVNIDVIDDGKGIDTTMIRLRAYEKGFIGQADVEALGEQESLQLLFKPGFSTAEAVTDLSGRGVGMDVVKTDIEKLGGKIEIFTTVEKGTTFRLLLPLTLAIIPSLIVEAEKQKFALPQINVQEIVRIKANDPERKIEFVNHSEVLRLRGRLLPIVHLADVLGLSRTYVDPATGERVPDKRKKIIVFKNSPEVTALDPSDQGELEERRGYKLTNIVRIIVIKIGARRLGLSVDTIHGSEEILVKTLPAHIKGCNNYSGVTILGDGKVAMILDPSGIIENSNLRYIDDRFEANNKLQTSEAERMRENQSLLLFKCSGPETLALDMAMVSRVEEVRIEDIETIGEKEYIKFRGEPLRIVRPEDYIAIRKNESSRPASGKCFVIIPKLVKHPMGILIEKMHDTMQASISLSENDSITTKGLIGSTILNDRIVILLNVYELFEMANPEQYRIEPVLKPIEPTKVLLVEDTPFFQNLEKGYLENAGYAVTVVENGRVALQALQGERFDIVVSDIDMPEMNGLELVKRIRSDSGLSGMPVIAVTSLTAELQKKEGLAAGFDAYEFKLDRSRLLEVVEQTFQNKRVKR